MLQFLLGFIIGGILGIFVLALCNSAKDEEGENK